MDMFRRVNLLSEEDRSNYSCYCSPCMYSCDECEDCKYDRECYGTFLDSMKLLPYRG